MKLRVSSRSKCSTHSSSFNMTVSVFEGVSPILPIVIFFVFLTIVSIVYQHFLHPIARFPGPFLAGLTDLSKFSYFWSLQIDKKLFALHEKYGPIVRIGPNELSFYGAGAVAPIYKSGRVMVKSHFYDGFTAFKPNVFGTRDEDVRLSFCLLSSSSHRLGARLAKTTNGSRVFHSFDGWNGSGV